ncbi:NAD-dependent dihydropyrimidine dehydrogenase subunit PreA [Desulfopila aestuarii]|uniref:dihydrouracil dehydrogenase (NAD(+)) n=1 Tax=Desulfopila aestuarii DSM 18488 TaxID=1121416 RepID=A0A1M7XWC5_9BACT|nr:NAD-dependent dihydropyrimidine dehydrogenase subunit PreA [Desulfopila aestuarii]SHO43061.1 dihydropyrimidine dehydrogenase (NAD+) subunit PreA [Desulfopila aestuarii DSM 18488]
MSDLSIDFCGISSPNPFWLASAPPTNSGEQIMRAFDTGWGGAVWKTLGNPVVNVNSRYAALSHGRNRIVGLNNIELITDRGLSINLREMGEVKKRFPKHALLASIMAGTRAEWQELIRRVEDTGADGVELNFSCPHGMCERGLGSAIGQEPAIAEEITRWAKESSSIPVLVKFTPNVADIRDQGRAAMAGAADGVALINTIKSIIGVDLDDFIPFPKLRNGSTNGGYCGPAVKPIALHMVASLGRETWFTLPMSGIGGINTWQDAAEFIALGCGSVQVCTAVMHHGFGIITEMIDGLSGYLDEKGMTSIGELQGRALGNYKEWGELDMNYKVEASIDAATCSGCGKCYTACNDGAYQAIDWSDKKTRKGKPIPEINTVKCKGCNLCSLVCPLDCISMMDVSHTETVESWQDIVARGGYAVSDGIIVNDL